MTGKTSSQQFLGRLVVSMKVLMASMEVVVVSMEALLFLVCDAAKGRARPQSRQRRQQRPR
jgi:hypothetical protein